MASTMTIVARIVAGTATPNEIKVAKQQIRAWRTEKRPESARKQFADALRRQAPIATRSGFRRLSEAECRKVERALGF